MSIISKDHIILQAKAKNKADAIRKAGKLLVESGCVLHEYIDGMLAREQSMSTNLGNGVAIPHGMHENRNHILKSGISVLQLKDGVDWDDDGKVYLVIGIAVASSDEHLGVLANLANAIDNENNLPELFQTTDPEVIMQHLGT